MREFLIFYAYSNKLKGGNTKFTNFVMEADSFPGQPYVQKSAEKDLMKFGKDTRFDGITGIIEVHRAEVPTWIS